ncbi:MAG: DUF6266 family protein [Dysgonamonadaceae bacterium]|nr:DUF6266 family protein [Dysgonamonadaceae bacterium]
MSYMRSLPQHIKNNNTEGQIRQRSKFALMMNFL